MLIRPRYNLCLKHLPVLGDSHNSLGCNQESVVTVEGEREQESPHSPQ